MHCYFIYIFIIYIYFIYVKYIYLLLLLCAVTSTKHAVFTSSNTWLLCQLQVKDCLAPSGVLTS